LPCAHECCLKFFDLLAEIFQFGFGPAFPNLWEEVFSRW